VPAGKAVNSKIGKGGNGFVFTMYHDRKQYAVKKVNKLCLNICICTLCLYDKKLYPLFLTKTGSSSKLSVL